MEVAGLEPATSWGGFPPAERSYRSPLRGRSFAQRWGQPHEGKDVLVRRLSDFSQREIPDDKQSVQVVLRYADGRRGRVVADAHVDDDLVQQVAQVGRQQARRGRRPKSEDA